MVSLQKQPTPPHHYEHKVDYSMFGTHKCVMKFCHFTETVLMFRKVRTNVANDCYFNMEIPYNKIDEFMVSLDLDNKGAAILLKLQKPTELKIIKELRLNEAVFTTEPEEDQPEKNFKKEYLAIKFKISKKYKKKGPSIDKIMIGVGSYYKVTNKDGIREIGWSEISPYLK